jgi:hypothetical protein
VLIAAILCEVAPAGAAATIPPDLASLEQQMAQLQANSERFSFQEEISLGGLHGVLGQGVPFTLLLAGDGEASDAPPQATFVGGLLGLPEEQARVIGNTRYSYRHQAAEIDGGRPWVASKSPTQQATIQGLDPGGILGNDQAGTQGTFSKLIEQLNGALTIEESGPVTVDEQRVIEFDATLDPAPFLAQLRSQSKEPKHPLGGLLETSPVGTTAPAAQSPPPTLLLEVFIAPNGLPVRARFTFTAEGTTIAVRVDTLAINIPVHIAPPPAAQTIEAAQLKQLEERRAAHELKVALRACRRLHGKRARQCRVLAKIKSRVPRSEPTPL